jgi:hypothetical protein
VLICSSVAPESPQPTSASDAVADELSFFSRSDGHGNVMQRTPLSSTFATGPSGAFGPCGSHASRGFR